LQKALEQGQVGLNELMNFIVQLGDEYAGVAEQIAGSSQDSGARLTVAFNEMRIAVGEALQPIGAEFQAAFADFIENITPVLVDVLPKVAEAVLGLVKNLDILFISAGAALGVFAVGKIAAIGGIGSALLGLATAAGTAAGSLQALNAAALLNPWTALAAGIAAVGVSLYSTWKEQQEFNRLLIDAPLDEINIKIDELRQKLADLAVESRSAESGMSLFGGSVGFASAEAAQLRQNLDELISRQRELALYRSVGVTPRAGYAGPGFAAPPGATKPTQFPRLTTTGGGRAGAGKKERESQLPGLLIELATLEKVFGIEQKIRQAQLDGNNLLQIRLEGEKQIAELAGQLQKLALEKIPKDEMEIKRKMLLLRVEKEREVIAHNLAMAIKQRDKEIKTEAETLRKTYVDQIQERNRLEALTSTGMTEALAKEYVQIE